MAHAMAHPSLLRSLGFFLDWPSLDCAARLLIDRHGEINGDHYEFLAPAAETLSERHPLAATLALRAMIDFTLTTSEVEALWLRGASTWSTCAGPRARHRGLRRRSRRTTPIWPG